MRKSLTIHFSAILLGGALLSSIVGWVATLAAPRSSPPTDAVWKMGLGMYVPFIKETIDAHVSGWIPVCSFGFGVAEFRDYPMGGRSPEFQEIVAAGWPCLALYGTSATTTAPSAATLAPSAFALPSWVPTRQFETTGLPITPYWPGFCASALFWSCPILACWCTARWLRSRRQGPNQCTSCGHVLLPANRSCPECGVARPSPVLGHRTRDGNFFTRNLNRLHRPMAFLALLVLAMSAASAWILANFDFPVSSLGKSVGAGVAAGSISVHAMDVSIDPEASTELKRIERSMPWNLWRFEFTHTPGLTVVLIPLWMLAIPPAAIAFMATRSKRRQNASALVTE